MRRESLEAAITALEALLDDEGAGEDRFQELFEQQEVILDVMGYVAALPRPRLALPDGGWLEPDFLVQCPNGIWEVLDLKTPRERILLDRQRRNTFDASMNSYIAQVEEYADYFADVANREAGRRAHGIDVQPTLDTVIIAGRDQTVDVFEIHRHSRRRGARLDIVTFDQVLAGLERAHAAEYAGLEDVAGVTFLSNIRIRRPHARGGRHYIQEVWGGAEAGAFALFLDNEALALEVSEPGGGLHAARAAEPAPFDRWITLGSEVGSGPRGGLLQLRVDDRVSVSLRLPVATLAAISLDFGTLGADRRGERGADFDLAEQLGYSHVLGFRERLELANYLAANIEEGIGSWVEFGPERYMAFEATATGDRTLHQSDDSRKPTFRKPS